MTKILIICEMVLYTLWVVFLCVVAYYTILAIADVGLEAILKNIWCGSRGCV